MVVLLQMLLVMMMLVLAVVMPGAPAGGAISAIPDDLWIYGSTVI